MPGIERICTVLETIESPPTGIIYKSEVLKRGYAVIIFSFNIFMTTAHISGMYLTLQHRPQGFQPSIDYTLNSHQCTVTCDYNLIVICEVQEILV
jgi:hypothetical protein